MADRTPRACDATLDALVLAFGVWTVVYDVCLVTGVRALPALAAAAVVLAPCAWLVLRARRLEPVAEEAPPPAPAAGRPPRALLGVHACAAIAAALVFAFVHGSWPAVWPLWLVAAGSALALVLRRRPAAAQPGNATLVAFAWALALAALSLGLVTEDADDAQYVHVASWVAAHGRFPWHDTLFSADVYPALFFPPLNSFEAFAGTVARATGLSAPDVVYLLVPPVGSCLAVLALWRLLRTWRVRAPATALSVALAFLLLSAWQHRMFGSFFVGRMWQGKVVFLAVLVPTLLSLLHEYADRPTRRGRALLAAAGAAGLGLTTTAIFVVPVIAAGALAPVALRRRRAAGGGLAAAAAVPLGAGVATVALGAREAASGSALDSGVLAHIALGWAGLGLIGVLGALAGPLAIRRASAAPAVASTVVLVGLLFTPQLPRLAHALTGVGQVQWRLAWALPVAALVGAGSAALGSRLRPALLRPAPAVVVCAALAVWGTPVWSPAAGATLEEHPVWKQPGALVDAANAILAHARPGDVILARQTLSQTILIISGNVTTVDPRDFYTVSLPPAAHPLDRLLLQRFVRNGLGPPGGTADGPVDAGDVLRALRTVGVDIACIPSGRTTARRLLVSAGYAPALTVAGQACLRARASAGVAARDAARRERRSRRRTAPRARAAGTAARARRAPRGRRRAARPPRRRRGRARPGAPNRRSIARSTSRWPP